MAIMLMSAAQCRVARAALKLSVLDLAKLTNMSTNTIVRLERGENLKDSTVLHVQRVLEAAGVEFLKVDKHGRIGISFTESV
ncbi:helix-turn-helix transcriptional regulator [Brucella pseudogrignonensis]|uniref:helix-turn-helix transcriptional regulator n=1 Tax=Brucella pseudogrignonensis TaxID=419475 RepID=UPI002E271ED8